MKKILKFVLVILGFRYVLRLMDENVDIKIQIKKLRNELANLETEDLENKIKDFFKKYDPKFKDQLKVWDQYPLIQLMEFNKGNLLGANIHHLKVRARLGAINNNRFPQSILRYYIPKKADGLFFEVDDMDVPILSQFPVEKLHRNR